MDMNPQQWLALKDRALAASAEGITIADARQPERPLIYVNEGFERLTGYSAEEALGKSCRFLQGDGSDQETVQIIRNALDEEIDCSVEIQNFRKDGTPFWNRLSITPVKDAEGQVTHFIGIQSDVTKRREAENALQEANAIMQHDLDEAAKIQRAWLPKSLPEVDGYNFAWSFTPCTELGGDSLNVIQLDQNHVGMYVLDVSGHGVPAALLSASIQRLLNEVPQQSCLFVQDETSPTGFVIAPPAVVAAKLNRRFQAELGKFCTLIYGVLDLRSGALNYVTAGHPPPLRVGPSGVEICPVAPGMPIGVVEDSEYEEIQVDLQLGDRILMYTDGATETADKVDEMYDENNLLKDLSDLSNSLSPDETLSQVMLNLRAWAGTEALDDDVTLLLIESS
jgi:PAS domain S-box-containing protein